MVKYCIRCGAQNDDQALFCTSCGQRLADQGMLAGDASVAPSAASAPTVPSARVLRFGLAHGDHKFVMGSVDFQDESGKVVYSASRESALHENYTVFEGETKLLYMKHKTHLNASTFELQDGSGAPLGELRCKYSRWQGQLPEFSYADPEGNSRAAVVWERRTFSFAIADPTSAQVFAQASSDVPGGVTGDLRALIRQRHRISIADGTSLPLTVVLAFCVAIAYMPPG